jgi:hypothetical protein
MDAFYNKILVRVPSPTGNEIDGDAPITLTVYGEPVANIGNVIYHYDQRRTPIIESVDRTDNEISIFGRGFEGDIVRVAHGGFFDN